MSDTVLQELSQGILKLTLNRPEKKNAFNTEQWVAFSDALDAARDNDEVSVVVITGAGRDFSAGQDLTEAGDVTEDGELPYRYCERAVIGFDKPLIGAARGVAVGGGATMLFYCDVLYVGKSLRMRMPFTSLGMAPEFACSYLLQANIGAQRAAELVYSSEWIDADKALEVGIARRKCSDDELLDKAMEKAAEIARWPLSSLKEAKRCFKLAHRSGIDAALKAEHEAMDRLKGSPENIEAVMAFLEKRAPDFGKLKR